METRASYIVVGSFSLLVVLASVVFVLWAAKSRQGDVTEYEILFRGGVSGLSIGNSVLFEGVRVGQVEQITISPQEPGAVHVFARMLADTPVRENSVASLEPQGITGLSVVAITGGTADSPMIQTPPGRRHAVIPSRPSQIQAIIATAPDVLNASSRLLDRTTALLSEENIRAFSLMLRSLGDVAAELAAQRQKIAVIASDLEDAGKNIAAGSKRFDALTQNSHKLVTENFPQAADAVDRAAKRLHAALEMATPGLAQFSREGSAELQRLLTEARTLTQSLNRLLQKLESDPRRFFFGNPVPEYTIP